MPQIQSQKKRVLTNNKRHLAVTSQKSALKTAIKAVLAAVDANDKEAAVSAYAVASSKLDKPSESTFKQTDQRNCLKRYDLDPIMTIGFFYASVSIIGS